MKKIIFLILISVVLNLSFVNALDVAVENYYPTPVEAGDYFNVWLKVTNREEAAVEGAVVQFKPSFPFSLDPGEEEQIVIDKVNAKSSVTKKFKIRVDKEAKEGENTIAFSYKDCSGCVWKEINMPITVIEYQTMFDIVLQEMNTDGVFFAIANIGKNSANAVTIRIPEQEFFRTDLISASIVGNLDSGDYTIVGFKISPVDKMNEEKELFIQIDYTDPFGVRRSVVKQIMINPSSLLRASGGVADTGSSSVPTGFNRAGMQQQSSFYTNVWFWTSIVLAILLFRKKISVIYKKIRKEKS
ncbi:MAG: hypothetical protein KKG75_00240 [Nanoarchaeota archaeon]|nr:hypothetical protein [Nanoarchaeota archaeon]